MAKISKGFRLSGPAVRRLEELAVRWELPQAVVLEQLLKREAESVEEQSEETRLVGSSR